MFCGVRQLGHVSFGFAFLDCCDEGTVEVQVQTRGREACKPQPAEVLFKGGRIIFFILQAAKEVVLADATLDLALLFQALPHGPVHICEMISIQSDPVQEQKEATGREQISHKLEDGLFFVVRQVVRGRIILILFG